MGKSALEVSVEETTEANCKDNNCIKLLQLIVDGEASPEQEAYFKDHIEDCATCFNNYRVETGMKKLIREKISNLSVPLGLQETILSKIKESV